MAGSRRSLSENYADFLGAVTGDEAAALRALPWQGDPLPGEAVAAQFAPEIGLTAITGAMPFLETPKMAVKPEGESWQYLKSEPLGHFLVENRALFRAYAHEASQQKYAIVGDYAPAFLAQVSTNIPGMEAANFAIFRRCTDKNQNIRRKNPANRCRSGDNLCFRYCRWPKRRMY